MIHTISAEFFISNRERLRNLFTGTAPIIITANGLLQRSADTTFPFRQDSNFWYLTGIDEPDVILVMDKGKEYLIVPSRSQTRAVFDGAVDTEQLSRISGIETILDEKAGWKQLGSRLSRVKHVATVGAAPAYIDAHGFYTNPARKRLARNIKRENAEISFLDLRDHLVRMRAIKQEVELSLIQQAIDTTTDAFKEIHKNLESYRFEYEIEADMQRFYRRHNAQMAYAPIIASGINACMLHYVANDSSVADNQALLLDVGAEVSNYAADITRTYFKGNMTKRQEKIHTAVLEAQDYAFGQLKPGIYLKDYEEHMEHYMGEKLRELGLIKVISHDTVRMYYPHATSHFLGLDVHDVGDYERPLEVGMVLTVEPGIYIPEEECGVRIEDNVLLTDSGIQILSDRLSRDPR